MEPEGHEGDYPTFAKAQPIPVLAPISVMGFFLEWDQSRGEVFKNLLFWGEVGLKLDFKGGFLKGEV